MRSGVLVWSAVTALLGVLLVEGAPADPVTDDCSDGDVRPFIVRSESETFSAALGGVLGDARGSFEICEDQFWRKVVLCVSDGGQQWTAENTAVACRELGYLAAASSGAATDQIVESSRRLTYMPQCEGGEERLRECPTVDQDDSCAAPLVISCWNSSAVSSQPSPTLTLTTHTSTTTAVPPLSPSTFPASSSLQLSTTTISEAKSLSPSQPEQTSLSVPTSSPSPSTDLQTTDTSPPPPPTALVSLAGAVGGVVLLLLVAIAAVLPFLLCRRRQRVRPQDPPYEVPVAIGARNQLFQQSEEVPETEALYDRVSTGHCHTLTHSPASTHHSPPLSSQSTASSTDGAAYATVGPPPSSQANPARDPPREKPPVYYHVLQDSRERAEEVKYHTLEESSGPAYHTLEESCGPTYHTVEETSGPTYHTVAETSGPAYHTLEETSGPAYHTLEETSTGRPGRGGGPVYSEVVQRQAAPASTISLPRNLSGSTTLL